MTVERDVCDFLAESGCLEIIAGAVSNSEEDATAVLGNCAAVLANAAARLEFNQKLKISDFGRKSNPCPMDSGKNQARGPPKSAQGRRA